MADEPENLKLYVVLPREIKERFEFICRLRRSPMGEVLRNAVDNYLKKHEEAEIDKVIASRNKGGAA